MERLLRGLRWPIRTKRWILGQTLLSSFHFLRLYCCTWCAQRMDQPAGSPLDSHAQRVEPAQGRCSQMFSPAPEGAGADLRTRRWDPRQHHQEVPTTPPQARRLDVVISMRALMDINYAAIHFCFPGRCWQTGCGSAPGADRSNSQPQVQAGMRQPQMTYDLMRSGAFQFRDQ